MKPSPALYEQRKQLERAKTGDLLKAKIQQRPQRQELEARHILEHHEGLIDPSLAERRRMLEKALLADQLNSKISHRPGPLELIEKNILHAEEPIERIVKEGLVTFKAANEGLQKGPPHPSSYMCYEEDSQSSEDHSQQSSKQCQPHQILSHEVAGDARNLVLTIPTSGGAVLVTSASIKTNLPSTLMQTSVANESSQQKHILNKTEQTTQNLYAQLCQNTISNNPTVIPIHATASPCSLESSTSSLSPLSSAASPQSILVKPKPFPQHQNPKQTDAPGKDKNRKKSKTRPVSKVKAIKFHEYKGPPSAKVNSNNNLGTNGETNYQLILKQQFLLEYLEGIYKHPPILPAPQKQTSESKLLPTQPVQTEPILMASSSASPVPQSPASTYSDTTSVIGGGDKLSKLKVSDLKMHLKKLNLPVSGSKPHLIERLRAHLPSENFESGIDESLSGETCEVDCAGTLRPSPDSEPEPMDIKTEIKEELQTPSTPQPWQFQLHEDDIVRDQQRKIEELQRKLKASQEQLEKMKSKTLDKSEPVAVRLKHQLEAKMQKEKLAQLEQQQKQQREFLACQQAKNLQSSLQNSILTLTTQHPKSQTINAFITQNKPESSNGLLTFYESNQFQITNNNGVPTLFFVGLDKKFSSNLTHQRANSLPSIVFPVRSGKKIMAYAG